MASQVSVMLSGPALSFLIYENTRSSCDQEGFLLGEVLSHVTHTISDSQIKGEKTETLINVNSLMPLPQNVSFYNDIGKIDKEKLETFLPAAEREIIGWYVFRRNTTLVPHMKDKLLHKQLQSLLPHISPEHFMMCLLNASVSNTGSTHSFNHKFVRYRYRNFEALPIRIHNLGEIQSEYITVPSTACLSDSFKNIIKPAEEPLMRDSDASLVCRIQKTLQEHLRKLIKDLKQSENKVSDLEQEVEVLRNSGALPNEVLLPQLLRENVTNPIEEDHIKLETPSVMCKSNNSQTVYQETNTLELSRKELNSDISPDLFAYVTEMKIEMSRPQSDPSCKQDGDKGQVTTRSGINRELRKTTVQQTKAVETVEMSPTRRQMAASQSEAPGVFPSKGSQSNSSNTPKRRGYANAVKRTVSGADSSVKPNTRSQVNSTNGSPTCSNSQD